MKHMLSKASVIALLSLVAVAGGCKSTSPPDQSQRQDRHFYCWHCGFHHPYSHHHYQYYYYERRTTPAPRAEPAFTPLPEPPAVPSPRPPRPLRGLKQPELPF